MISIPGEAALEVVLPESIPTTHGAAVRTSTMGENPTRESSQVR